jgi:hypothetical protein
MVTRGTRKRGSKTTTTATRGRGSKTLTTTTRGRKKATRGKNCAISNKWRKQVNEVITTIRGSKNAKGLRICGECNREY